MMRKKRQSKMGFVVAIGGGEMGRTKVYPDGKIKKYPIETLCIDEKISQLPNKKRPKLLFLGTATRDRQSYIDTIKQYYENNFNCRVTFLKLSSGRPTYSTIKNKILTADIIYVGSGDTLYMLNVWKKKKVIPLLKKAYKNGAVLCGISAGAICWFEFYDNMDYTNGDIKKFKLLKGLGLIKGFGVPHYDCLSQELKQKIYEVLTQKGLSGVIIDECSAYFYNSNKSFSLSSKDNKKVSFIIPQ